MLKQRFVRILAGAAIVAASLVVTAPAAPAYAGGYGCTGTFVGGWPIYGSEGASGDIDLYYDSGTGWNCAVAVKRSNDVFYGLATNMYIHMNNSSYDDNHIKNNYASDSGMYKYYAGPVRVYGNNMCIWITGGIAENSGPNSDSWDYDVRNVNKVACS
jgi:hypothetical protein